MKHCAFYDAKTGKQRGSDPWYMRKSRELHALRTRPKAKRIIVIEIRPARMKRGSSRACSRVPFHHLTSPKPATRKASRKRSTATLYSPKAGIGQAAASRSALGERTFRIQPSCRSDRPRSLFVPFSKIELAFPGEGCRAITNVKSGDVANACRSIRIPDVRIRLMRLIQQADRDVRLVRLRSAVIGRMPVIERRASDQSEKTVRHPSGKNVTSPASR